MVDENWGANIPDEALDSLIQALLTVKMFKSGNKFVPSENYKLPSYVTEKLKEISREQELLSMRLREVIEYIDLEEKQK